MCKSYINRGIASSGIIYWIKRKETEEIAKILKSKYGICWDFFHAELSVKKRNEIQEKWMKNKIQVIVATIAFGMGINKKDVRFIIHVGFPKSIEAYIQEWGRAGRDSLPAKWILYYNYGDRRLLDWFIIKSQTVSSNNRKEENLHSLYKMIDYLEEKCEWRRKLQLLFLGEHFKTKDCKQNWDNWVNTISIEEKEVTKEAKIIVNFVQEINDNNITMLQIIPILWGRKSTIKNDSISSAINDYSGRLKHLGQELIQRLIIKLLILRILKEHFEDNKYGINSYIRLGAWWNAVNLKENKFFISIASNVPK